MNPFGHVDLRVSDLDAAFGFYGALLPALGFTETYHGESWKVWATTEPLPATAYFGVTEERDHVPNANRIAFWVASAAEVDRVAAVAVGAGAAEMSGPKPMPYGPGYYAAFFADPCGNRFEVYVRPDVADDGAPSEGRGGGEACSTNSDHDRGRSSGARRVARLNAGTRAAAGVRYARAIDARRSSTCQA